MTDAIKIILGGVVALLGKIVWDWLAHPRKSNGNGASGERSVIEWEKRIRDIMEEVMDRRNMTLKELFRDVLREERE